MELTFRVFGFEFKNVGRGSRNPCFFGTYFWRTEKRYFKNDKTAVHSLNPCFCGTYFSSLSTLNGRQGTILVLILVFVELTFRGNFLLFDKAGDYKGLNPCFCGTYFSSSNKKSYGINPFKTS